MMKLWLMADGRTERSSRGTEVDRGLFGGCLSSSSSSSSSIMYVRSTYYVYCIDRGGFVFWLKSSGEIDYMHALDN